MNTVEKSKKLEEIQQIKKNLFSKIEELCRVTERKIEELKAG